MELNIWIALWAGFASFISPCCLPLYPSYLSYITGVSVSQLKDKNRSRDIRVRTLTHTLFFMLGFSVIYYALGLVAGAVAEVFVNYSDLISKLAAILIIVMGLILIGVFKPQMLMRSVNLDVKVRKPGGYLASFLIGIGFAAGWSPCVGPILGAIISLAASEKGLWFKMITAYTIGFSVPFFIMAYFIGSLKVILKYSNVIMKIGGACLIAVGLLLYTGQLLKITIWLNSITPSWLTF